MEELAAILKKVIVHLDIPRVILQQHSYTEYEIGQKISLHKSDTRDKYYGGPKSWRCWFSVSISKGRLKVINRIEVPAIVLPIARREQQVREYVLADPNFFSTIIADLQGDVRRVNGQELTKELILAYATSSKNDTPNPFHRWLK